MAMGLVLLQQIGADFGIVAQCVGTRVLVRVADINSIHIENGANASARS